jgi:hypothetical protein
MLPLHLVLQAKRVHGGAVGESSKLTSLGQHHLIATWML